MPPIKLINHVTRDLANGAQKLVKDVRATARAVVRDAGDALVQTRAAPKRRRRRNTSSAGVPNMSPPRAGRGAGTSRTRRNRGRSLAGGSAIDTRVVHREEFIGHLSGSSTLAIQTQNLNPLNTVLFPIGSAEALQYDMYRFTRLRLILRSTAGSISSTAAFGTMGIGMVYDADDPVFTTETELLNYDSGRSFKAWAIDTKGDLFVDIDVSAGPVQWRYVQHDGSVPLSDIGTYYAWASANPTTSGIAMQYIQYTVEYKKPRIPNSISAQVINTYFLTNSTAWAFAPLYTGSISVSNGPSFAYLPNADNLYFNTVGYYHVTVTGSSGADATGGTGGVAANGGCAFVVPTGYASALTQNLLTAPSNGVYSVGAGEFWVLVSSLPAYLAAGTYPFNPTTTSSDASTITISKYNYPPSLSAPRPLAATNDVAAIVRRELLAMRGKRELDEHGYITVTEPTHATSKFAAASSSSSSSSSSLPIVTPILRRTPLTVQP